MPSTCEFTRSRTWCRKRGSSKRASSSRPSSDAGSSTRSALETWVLTIGTRSRASRATASAAVSNCTARWQASRQTPIQSGASPASASQACAIVSTVHPGSGSRASRMRLPVLAVERLELAREIGQRAQRGRLRRRRPSPRASRAAAWRCSPPRRPPGAARASSRARPSVYSLRSCCAQCGQYTSRLTTGAWNALYGKPFSVTTSSRSRASCAASRSAAAASASAGAATHRPTPSTGTSSRSRTRAA